MSVFTWPQNEPKKLNTWYSLDLLCVVINLSEDLFLIRKDLLPWLAPCCHEISLCLQYNALCQGLPTDLTDLPLTVLGFQSWVSLPFFVGSILHLLHDHFLIQIMKTNVLFLSWRVHFWDLRLQRVWVSQGAGIWWLGGCSGWSYDAGYGIAFLKMTLSVYLPCSSFPL